MERYKVSIIYFDGKKNNTRMSQDELKGLIEKIHEFNNIAKIEIKKV